VTGLTLRGVNDVILDTNMLLSNEIDKDYNGGWQQTGNLLSFWKLLKELNDGPEEISDARTMAVYHDAINH
jgi:hypothetical protein